MNLAVTLGSNVSDEPAIRRLAALAELDDDALCRLRTACRLRRRIAARRDILVEGAAIEHSSILLEGWACRVRTLADGRRQILDILLPGDLIGFCPPSRAVSLSTVMALTPVAVCPAPMPPGPALAEAYAVSHALEQGYWLRQITRLGRLSAYERVTDWVMEIIERLELSGSFSGDSTPFPVTQEVIADTLGLTSVHVNRTLQAIRRDGLLQVASGKLTLLDRRQCLVIADVRRPPR